MVKATARVCLSRRILGLKKSQRCSVILPEFFPPNVLFDGVGWGGMGWGGVGLDGISKVSFNFLSNL